MTSRENLTTGEVRHFLDNVLERREVVGEVVGKLVEIARAGPDIWLEMEDNGRYWVAFNLEGSMRLGFQVTEAEARYLKRDFDAGRSDWGIYGDSPSEIIGGMRFEADREVGE